MILRYLNQIIFPKSCLICHKIINNGLFCSDHWNKIEFITDPFCKICHLPFDYKTDNNICASCLSNKTYYTKLIAVCKYNDMMAKLIGNFKFFDQTYLAKELSKLLYPKLQEFISDIDFIIAVPLYKKKLRKRKFNQSILLAKFIAKKYDIKLIPDLLVRIKEGSNQIGLNKRGRIKNVRNAFLLNQKYKDIIKNKNILIIDDVVTTGATINNCSKILTKHAVGGVFAAVIAKRILD